jgi:hypothetical protein
MEAERMGVILSEKWGWVKTDYYHMTGVIFIQLYQL